MPTPPFPPATHSPPVGAYGSDPFGSSPFGSDFLPFGLLGAQSLNDTLVRLTFTDLLDFTFSPLLNPTNYVFSGGLSAVSVIAESAFTIIVQTSLQSDSVYSVTVTSARSYYGVALDPSLTTGSFLGTVSSASFSAIAVQQTKVRLVFTTAVLNDSNFSNPSNYVVTDLGGTSIPVTAVTGEQSGNPTSAFLTLGTPLQTTKFYQVTISPFVRTVQGSQNLSPPSVFQWVAGTTTTTIPISAFSGEVSGGLFGNPAGLVFFSPALNVPAANSIIQVDEVDVCTTASDTYTFPVPVDPVPLFTYSPQLPPTDIGPQTVLWAPWPRLSEAQFNLGNSGAHQVEVMPAALDGPCSVLMNEPFAHDHVALLNNPAWHLYNGATTTVPPVFITAMNTAPIPPGPESILILNMPFRADSHLTGTLTSHHAIAAQLTAGSQLSAGLSHNTPIAAQIGADSHVSGTLT